MSEHFRVHGGARLVGAVDVIGAKNSVLKLMAAALLAEGTTTITNCPRILDVPFMADVLRSIGCDVTVDGDTVTITTPAVLNPKPDAASMGKLRASVCVLGPWWVVAAKPWSRFQAVTRSAPVRWTCTRAASVSSARPARSNTARSWPTHRICAERRSGSTSPASALPRTS
ncbi:hypothetical protein GCM10029964_107910 [Kibdelosporangium lantanae]